MSEKGLLNLTDIQAEHSYSLSEDSAPQSPALSIKMDHESGRSSYSFQSDRSLNYLGKPAASRSSAEVWFLTLWLAQNNRLSHDMSSTCVSLPFLSLSLSPPVSLTAVCAPFVPGILLSELQDPCLSSSPPAKPCPPNTHTQRHTHRRYDKHMVLSLQLQPKPAETLFGQVIYLSLSLLSISSSLAYFCFLFLCSYFSF